MEDTRECCHIHTLALSLTHTRTHSLFLSLSLSFSLSLSLSHGRCYQRREDTLEYCQYVAVQHTAIHCSTLQHIVTHCNTLQHTATHCNTLQHTATQRWSVLSAQGRHARMLSFCTHSTPFPSPANSTLVRRCITLQHTAKKMQHSASRCNIL